MTYRVGPMPAWAHRAPPGSNVGERGDILMFTTRNAARPFVGRYAFGAASIVQSDVAEVAWFLRGKTLHRRVLLVGRALVRTLQPTPRPITTPTMISRAHRQHQQPERDRAQQPGRFNQAGEPLRASGVCFSLRCAGLGTFGASHLGRMLVADLDGQLGQWHYAFAPTSIRSIRVVDIALSLSVSQPTLARAPAPAAVCFRTLPTSTIGKMILVVRMMRA